MLLGHGRLLAGPGGAAPLASPLARGPPARCTCWTRPTPPAIGAVAGRGRPERTLFIVSSKSGGTIEPLSLFAHFRSLVGDGRPTSRRSPTPARAWQTLAAASTASADVRRRPGHRRSLQRAVRLRASCPAALTGIDVARAARRERRRLGDGARQRRLGEDGNAAGATPALLARAALSALARRRARQAHVRDLRRRCPASGCGSSSWWRSPPASTARASCRSPKSRSASPRSTATTACSPT